MQLSGIFETLSQTGSAFQDTGDNLHGVGFEPVLKCTMKILKFFVDTDH